MCGKTGSAAPAWILRKFIHWAIDRNREAEPRAGGMRRCVAGSRNSKIIIMHRSTELPQTEVFCRSHKYSCKLSSRPAWEELRRVPGILGEMETRPGAERNFQRVPATFNLTCWVKGNGKVGARLECRLGSHWPPLLAPNSSQ